MKKLLLLIALFVSAKHGFAQQYPLIGQYMFNKLFYNPAFAGTNESVNGTVFYRHQWAGFSGAPKTFLFNVDAPIQNQKAGLGLNVMNDSRGVTNQTDFYLNYAYRIPVANETNLSMGIKGGASYFRSGLTDLNPEKDETIFNENITSALLPKVGFGLYLYNPTFYAGISTPDLVTYDPNKVFSSSNGKTFSNRKNYLFTAGYNLYVNELLALTPNALVKYYPTLPLFVDLNLNALYADKFLIGASYRYNNAFTFIGQIVLKDKLKAGVAYELKQPGQVIPVSYGTMELMLSYGIE